MSTCDPILPDTRPPTFAKGQSFGTVPHRRVVVVTSNSSGLWDFLNRGVVLPFVITTGSDPNNTSNTWREEFDANDATWDCFYRWSVDDPQQFTVDFRVVIQRLDGQATASWERAGVAVPIVAATRSMPELAPSDPDGAAASITKFEVPPWADPSERWPDVICVGD